MESPLVYIVILNWNGLNDTIECLDSIKQSDYNNYKVIVVDNCSTDNSVTVFKQAYPWVTVIENKCNLGFTGGNNVAIQYALRKGADYIWLLNNDTTVESSCLKHLVDASEASVRVGLVSPVIYYFDNPQRKQFSGSFINLDNLKLFFPDLSKPVADVFMSGSNVVLWGTALLIKANLVRHIGVLKEEYFAYWEDTEYSLRALKTGYENKVCSVAKIYHRTSSSETIRPSRYYHYYMVRNHILLCQEYLSAFQRFRFYKNKFANLCITMQCYIDVDAMEAAEAILDGFIHGILSLTGPMIDNKHVCIKKGLKCLMLWHPYFLASLLEMNLKRLYQQLCGLR